MNERPQGEKAKGTKQRKSEKVWLELTQKKCQSEEV